MSAFRAEGPLQVLRSHKFLPYQATPLSPRFPDNPGRGGLGTRPGYSLVWARAHPHSALGRTRPGVAPPGGAAHPQALLRHRLSVPPPARISPEPSPPRCSGPVPGVAQAPPPPGSSPTPAGRFPQILPGAPGIRPVCCPRSHGVPSTFWAHSPCWEQASDRPVPAPCDQRWDRGRPGVCCGVQCLEGRTELGEQRCNDTA